MKNGQDGTAPLLPGDLRWDPIGRGSDSAVGRSGDITIGMVGRRSGNPDVFFYVIDGVDVKYVAKSRGEARTLKAAKRKVENAWRTWLERAGILQAPPESPVGDEGSGSEPSEKTADEGTTNGDTPLTRSLRRACAMYNDRPLRALRAENPELSEDGVTVFSDGSGYEPRDVRDMLGWLAAGQWDADGPDPSVGDAELVRPAHARLTSWWRRNRNADGI